MKKIVPFLLILLVVAAGLWLKNGPEADSHLDTAPMRPHERGWIMRTYPHYQADADVYRVAHAQKQALRLSAKRSVRARWTQAGPTNIGGRVVDIEINPEDTNILYAAAATGGLFKTTDQGNTWHPIFDNQPVLNMGDVALDPTNPDILYVGTGEANGGHNNYAGGGVYKSVDGGATWSFKGLEKTVSIGRVRVHPTNPQRLYVAAIGSYFAPNPERGLYRSDDGGDSWERILFVNDSTGVIDFIMRPDNPDVLLAASWQRTRRPTGSHLYGQGSALYRSTDGGDSWERLGPTQGLPDPDDHRQSDGRTHIGRIGLALCESQPDVMYAYYSTSSAFLGLYRTDDGGDSWYDTDPQKNITKTSLSTPKARLRFTFGWYFGQIRVHPDDPDDLFLLEVELNRTRDGGKTWDNVQGPHVDYHALAFHPTDRDIIFVGNDGGVAYTVNDGDRWLSLQKLSITQFYEIAYDPNNPERLFGGTQDNGTLFTMTGDPDRWEKIIGGDGFYVIVNPRDPTSAYTMRPYGLLSRVDGIGFSPFGFAVLTPNDQKRNLSTPIVIDPDDYRTLYYGTSRLWRTQDAVESSWVAISPDLTKGTEGSLVGTISTIAVAPSNTNVLYVGTDDGNVWVSPDYGTTWNDVTGDLPVRWVTRIAVDPNDANTAYVTYSGLKWKDPQPHVFRTRDQGASWENITANLPDVPVNAFALDPLRPRSLYAGTDLGVFASFDDGLRWEPLDEGMPSVVVSDLKFEPITRLLVACTHGRSMYTFPVDGLVTHAEAETTVPRAQRLSQNYPNPFTTSTTLRLSLEAPAPVRLDLFDLLGRRIHTLHDGPLASGPHALTWDGRNATGQRVASGTYIARLTINTTMESVVMTLAE